MKQIKIIIAIAIITVLSLSNVHAGKTNDTTAEVPVELTYMGIFKNQPLFQLNFSGSAEENEFSISVTDENGYVFYRQKVKGEKFSKQFLLNTENLEDANIQFIITGKKSGKSVVYRINRQLKTIEQTDVVKL
jgi:hypothetical protein